MPACQFWLSIFPQSVSKIFNPRFLSFLGELVLNQKNGSTFKNSTELGQQLETYLTTDGGGEKLEEYRKYLLENRVSWDDHWDEVALPQLV